jgi:DNA invertase Pin-like site-specific DNA recombinase
VVRTAEELHKRGVLIRGLNDGVDYSTPTGRMIAGILASRATPRDQRRAVTGRDRDAIRRGVNELDLPHPWGPPEHALRIARRRG